MKVAKGRQERRNLLSSFFFVQTNHSLQLLKKLNKLEVLLPLSLYYFSSSSRSPRQQQLTKIAVGQWDVGHRHIPKVHLSEDKLFRESDGGES